jgi:very-short-patch-repair endonuclease
MRGFHDTDLLIARLADRRRGIVHRRQLPGVVEVDGWAFHRTRRAFERDRERDAFLAAGGIRVLRFTHRQVTGEPALVAAALVRR